MSYSATVDKKKIYGTAYRKTEFLNVSKKIVMTIDVYNPYRKVFVSEAMASDFDVEETGSTRFKTTYKVTADRQTQQMDMWNFSSRLTHAFF